MKALIYMSHLFFENVLQEYACIGVEGFLGLKRMSTGVGRRTKFAVWGHIHFMDGSMLTCHHIL